MWVMEENHVYWGKKPGPDIINAHIKLLLLFNHMCIYDEVEIITELH